MNILCIFHNDPDGIAAAYLYYREHPEATFICAGHEKTDSLIKQDIVAQYDKVVIADFSLPVEYMKKHANKITLIDHHAHSIEWAEQGLLDDLDHYLVSKDGAGCLLMWKYLYGNKKVPKIIQLISDYDNWTNITRENRALMAWFETRFVDESLLRSSVLKQLMEEITLDKCLDKGYAKLTKLEPEWKDLIDKHSYEVQYGDRKGLAVEYKLASAFVFGELFHKYDFVCIWKKSASGSYKVSFRSDNDTKAPCRDIALSMGGGGHEYACACMVDKLPKWLRKND